MGELRGTKKLDDEVVLYLNERIYQIRIYIEWLLTAKLEEAYKASITLIDSALVYGTLQFAPTYLNNIKNVIDLITENSKILNDLLSERSYLLGDSLSEELFNIEHSKFKRNGNKWLLEKDEQK